MVQNLSFGVRPDPYGAFRQASDDRVAREQAAEERRRAEQTRSVNAGMASAIGNEDWEGLGAIGAKSGDPDIANAARSRAGQGMFQQAYQASNELSQIAQLPPEQRIPAYQRWRGTVLSRAQRLGVLTPEAQTRFDQQHPAQVADPEQVVALAARAREQVAGLANQQQTPEGYMDRVESRAQAEREQLEADRRFEQGERRLDQSERRMEAVLARSGGQSQDFGRANSLRDEYNQQTAGFRTVADIAARSEQYVQRIPQTGASGQGDVGLVYALAKIYDPTSVVREGEFATMARQGGYGEQMRSWVLQAQGRGFSDEIRRQILTEIRNGVRSQQAQRDQTRSRYEALAQRHGIDPIDVIDDYQASGSPAQGGGGGATALPPINQRVVGQVYTMPNGDQATWNGRDFD